MFQERQSLYGELEQSRHSHLIAYVLGDRRGMETQMASEVLDLFVQHLDALEDFSGKISLFLYSRGGDTLAAWSIANLLRQFCQELEVIVPAKAHSAATLLCLSADTILMTKQATLGPIDPSINTPLNPGIPGAPPEARYSVSVEAILGFIELAKKEFSIEDAGSLASILTKLAEHVHPLVLGEVFRRQRQIKELAGKLLSHHLKDEDKTKRIIDFLCSESGSHDYTINRKEARDLGLPVERPDDTLYRLVKGIYDDMSSELELTDPFDKARLLGNEPEATYQVKRGLIESLACGSHVFATEGAIRIREVQVAEGMTQSVIEERKDFEGWRHDVQS